MTGQPPVQKGGWVEERTLGSGGFGTVTLWRHEETGECIALKKCRLTMELTTKHKRRWEMEVEIMKRLQHDNVIQAREVPPPLDVGRDEMPLLAMEYCSGGDLRKTLIKPENCCGMKEYEIRSLIKDVAAAVEYLHSKRIIHRDLKPENIVLSPGEERTIYKLIDLGYAKDLDQGSVCTSFVGTLQYLAPELFASQRYTSTVDYWSLGTVVFECVTGYRPFLPLIPPVRWHKEVCKKSPEDISAVFDSKGEVKFSKTIPKPNHLCRTMATYIEQWLKLMLRWDPKARGGGMVGERPKCFVILDRVLEIKVLLILVVETNKILSYPITHEYKMVDIQRTIEQETRIPVAEQLILLASGLSPDPEGLASQCWSERGDEEWVVFLFRRSEMSQANRSKPMPQLVQYMVKEPLTLMPQPEQRQAWAQAVYFCQEQTLDMKRLVLSQRAAMLHLFRMNADFLKLKEKMQNNIGQLMARKDHFVESLQFDIDQYKEQMNTGLKSEKMFARWMKMGDDIEKFSTLRERADQLVQNALALQTKIMQLQKSPFSRPKQHEALSESEELAKELYSELRQSAKDHRSERVSDHRHIVTAVVKSVLYRDQAMQEVYTHLSKICQCRMELERIIPEVNRCCEDIEAAKAQLSSHQRARQHDIWNLLKVAVKQSGVGPSPGSLDGLKRSGSQSSTGSFVSAPSLSSSSNNPESLRLIQDTQRVTDRFDEVMRGIMVEHEESMSLMQSLTDFVPPGQTT